MQRRLVVTAAALAISLAGSVRAAEDAAVGAFPFADGDVVGFDRVSALKPFLPAEFWDNRDFFFYEGMRLEVGPPHRDYSPAREYVAATERFSAGARLGPDGSLEGYVAGQPFPMEKIDCRRDPDAGSKIMWNFDYQWEGDGGGASFLYSYWDRGEQLPLFYQGQARGIQLSHRVEKEYLDGQDGDIFRGEKRKSAASIDVQAPFDARGIALLSYRYKASDGPRAESKNDDTWVYVPQLRRVRRISTAQRTDAVSGTDFTLDDLRSFAGIVPQYEWTCLGEMELVAPMNSRARAYPYDGEHDFGPYGLSFANDRWELRKAVKIRMKPKNADHPYDHKDIYIDRETLSPLYSFAYDHKQELWKIIWHNRRWSEDGHAENPAYYPPWEGVAAPRDLKVVGDIIVNVQTGTGNRIEFWDVDGSPLPSKGQLRRYIDVGRLTKGR